MPAEPQAPTEHSESQGEGGGGEAVPASAGLLTVFISYESLKLTANRSILDFIKILFALEK